MGCLYMALLNGCLNGNLFFNHRSLLGSQVTSLRIRCANLLTVLESFFLSLVALKLGQDFGRRSKK